MTAPDPDKAEGEAAKNSAWRTALKILAVLAFVTLFIISAIVFIVAAFAAFAIVVYFLSIVALIFHHGEPRWLF